MTIDVCEKQKEVLPLEVQMTALYLERILENN